jgi:hypothetical protein
MNIEQFWLAIDSVHVDSGGDMDRKCELLKSRLDDLNEHDLRDFSNHFDAADAGAYTWPLWGAAYVIHGGCSDDTFSDFRASLISRGSETYQAALANPESLADLNLRDEEDIFYEGFQYVRNDVAEEKLGEIPSRLTPFPEDPSGDEWDEDSVNDLFPRLSAKYSSTDDESRGEQPKKPWWRFW